MSDRLNALGQYIIEQTKRNFNFKQIKMIQYIIIFYLHLEQMII